MNYIDSWWLGGNYEINKVKQGQFWGRVNGNRLDKTSDTSKLSDLKNCQKVAKQMTQNNSPITLDPPFYEIHNAFRLTGCHFEIIESEGNIIAKIV